MVQVWFKNGLFRLTSV